MMVNFTLGYCFATISTGARCEKPMATTMVTPRRAMFGEGLLALSLIGDLELAIGETGLLREALGADNRPLR